ncbi:hypothetical protein ACOMHN_034099 [Nucella lapillus]
MGRCGCRVLISFRGAPGGGPGHGAPKKNSSSSQLTDRVAAATCKGTSSSSRAEDGPQFTQTTPVGSPVKHLSDQKR